MYHHSCSVKQKRTDFSSTLELHFREGRELTLQYYTPRVNHRTRQNPGPDKHFLPKGETSYRRRFFGSNTFIYEDCKSDASLSKSNSQHVLHLAPLGQFCNQKKAVARPFLEQRSSDCSVSLVLCYFLPLSLQKSCCFSGRHTKIITSPSRPCSFIPTGLCNSAFVGSEELAPVVLEPWYNQRALLFVSLISEPTHHPLQCTQAVTVLKYLKNFFFFF